MWNVAEDNQQRRRWFPEDCGSGVIIAWRRLVATVAPGTRGLKPLYKTSKPRAALLPPRVPTVRKWDDASFRLPGPSPRNLLK
jgi:hypothetical protein